MFVIDTNSTALLPQFYHPFLCTVNETANIIFMGDFMALASSSLFQGFLYPNNNPETFNDEVFNLLNYPSNAFLLKNNFIIFENSKQAYYQFM